MKLMTRVIVGAVDVYEVPGKRKQKDLEGKRDLR